MRLLHTSDWHLGKVLKGVPRLDEQTAVLDEIVGVATDERVDLVLVAGDLYESAVPPAEAQALAWQTLLRFRDTGAHVVVIAGNHDNGLQFEAIRPLAAAAGIHVLGRPRRPQDGGVIDLTTAGGQCVRLAALPFVSQRYVVRAAELMSSDAAQLAGGYAERCRTVLDHLCAGFGADTVNIVVAHAMVRGGRLGGGERDAQTIEDYWIDATAFPPTAQYVALGHLHRTQPLPAPAPVWYSGSPIQIDFGEGGDAKHVLVADVDPGRPAKVTEVPLRSPRRLRTLEGTLAELTAMAPEVGDDLLRVIVQERSRAGLADDVRTLLPNALDIRLAAPEDDGEPGRTTRQGKTPHELFAGYLAERDIDDERLEALFAQLLDEASEPDR